MVVATGVSPNARSTGGGSWGSMKISSEPPLGQVLATSLAAPIWSTRGRPSASAMFFDDWRIGLGEHIVHRLDAGLRSTRNGIVIVRVAPSRRSDAPAVRLVEPSRPIIPTSRMTGVRAWER